MTKAQQRVVDLMREGWALCSSHGTTLRKRVWLQKNGGGRGGETQEVRSNVLGNMQTDGIVEVDEQASNYPLTVWKLGRFAGAGKPKGGA